MSIIRWWKRRKLRQVQERYARCKAEREELQRQLACDWVYASNPYNRNRVIRAAGKEAMYLERVETLMRA